jgi:hypothetical protein
MDKNTRRMTDIFHAGDGGATSERGFEQLLNLTGVPFDDAIEDIYKSIPHNNYVQICRYRAEICPKANQKARYGG